MALNGSYNVIKKNGESEIVVTKSRFIGNLVSVSSASEAEEYINSIRKKYNDARHNCWAYIVMDGEMLINKCSDDGEPSGTAGRPILSIIEGAGLVNAVCTVTRYFGGVLLGTGGLVRAYSDAASQALENADISPIRRGIYITFVCDYPDEGGIRRLLESEEYTITDSEYTDKVTITVLGPEERSEGLMNRICDMTGGKVIPKAGETVYY